MLNHIVLHGRLTRDPELRYTQSSVAVASFTLAVERDAKAQDGTRKTDFIDCVVWRGAAEFLCKYFRKGSAAIVGGRLELRDWTDKDGSKRRSAEVNVSELYFGESKKQEASAPGAYYEGAAEFSDMSGIDDANLPF